MNFKIIRPDLDPSHWPEDFSIKDVANFVCDAPVSLSLISLSVYLS
jgi:hypothetical protein